MKTHKHDRIIIPQKLVQTNGKQRTLPHTVTHTVHTIALVVHVCCECWQCLCPNPTSNTHIHIEEIQVAVSYKHIMERSSQRYVKLKDTFIHNLHSFEKRNNKHTRLAAKHRQATEQTLSETYIIRSLRDCFVITEITVHTEMFILWLFAITVMFIIVTFFFNHCNVYIRTAL